jgi:hypothetical protein
MTDLEYERAATLRAEIHRICTAVDHLDGKVSGTTERACYFHLWDEDLSYLTNIDVLVALRADAMGWLIDAVAHNQLTTLAA